METGLKDTKMTLRIEPELHQAFNEAAKRLHRPAAQVIRELMRQYVEYAQENESRSIMKRIANSHEQWDEFFENLQAEDEKRGITPQQ